MSARLHLQVLSAATHRLKPIAIPFGGRQSYSRKLGIDWFVIFYIAFVWEAIKQRLIGGYSQL